VTADPLSVPLPRISAERLHALLAEEWALTGELTPLHGERDLNFRLDAPTGRRLVVKVHNHADGEAVVDLQTAALRHVHEVAPELPVCTTVATGDGRFWAGLAGDDGRRSFVRVLTWLDGRHPDPAELDERALGGWGRTVAALGRALRGFVHPAASYPIAWDIRRLPTVRPWLPAVPDEHRAPVATVLARFAEHTTGALERVRAQVVHNDMSDENVLVDETLAVSGITDFGDLTHTALVCDLAVAVADVLAGRPDALDAAPAMIAGYHAVTPLEPEEAALLADLVAGRSAAAVTISAWRRRAHPTAPPLAGGAARLLHQLLDAGLETVGRSFAAAAAPYRPRPTAELAARRAAALGPLELSYRTPLHLVRGAGVRLVAADGRAYLDAYNNVPVLGHGHPAVTAAVAGQLALLNTNSRYLHEAGVELAETLLATLPAGFDRVLLVNSGSEANDLAWRIARHVTGNAGAVVTRYAYHGVTEATTALSPEGWPKGVMPAPVRLADPPGRHDGAAVGDAVAELAASGFGLAAVFADGVFTSDGVLGPAHEWSVAAAAAAHAAGGLYVADEVQAGHGRTGAHLWSFAAGNVPADLVTLGKPMGNGYPVAAVAGPARLIDGFMADTGYFSTFGGGTAACVAALAVLRAIEAEELVARAASVGSLLAHGVRDLAAGSERLAEVRGWGLSVGVDVVGPAGGRPDPDGARRIVEGMRDRGVLIGRTAATGATLKIRPPLVFSPGNVAELVGALAGTLAEW
jgi:4-aminobutyrate aminotransferase-like enzyme/Ser/Thr protein kinase RdoA (MazF antagonist)